MEEMEENIRFIKNAIRNTIIVGILFAVVVINCCVYKGTRPASLEKERVDIEQLRGHLEL